MAKGSFFALLMAPVRKAEKAITPAYTQLLRQHVSSMPNWTDDAVENLNIRYKNNNHVITYTDDSILDIENGTPDVPFSAGMRTFMIKQAGKR